MMIAEHPDINGRKGNEIGKTNHCHNDNHCHEVLLNCTNETNPQEDDPCIPEWYKKPNLILGCGNRIFGDDGFGPAVVAYLADHYTLPEDVCVMDAGISARGIIFPLLIEETTVKRIIIIDAVDFLDRGRKPGEVFEISIEEIPFLKVDDFSMHQIPTSNMLKDLRDRRNIKVIVLTCQIEHIPDTVWEGLSLSIERAIPLMAERITGLVGGERTSSGR